MATSTKAKEPSIRKVRSGSRNGVEKTRTTLLLPTIIDRNLERYCFIDSKQKTEVVEEALARFLRTKKIDPYKDQKMYV